MAPLFTFGNPAVKILREHLWESARQRYLQDHPSDRGNNSKAVMRKIKAAYETTLTVSLKEAEGKVKAKWREFKSGRTQELKTSLATVFRMSDLDWYSVEVGPAVSPAVIAVPYQVLKRTTTALLFQSFRKEMQVEDIDDESLQALCTYAADEKFHDVLEDARRHYTTFKIGKKDAYFVLSELIEKDAYFLGDEEHHSLIDILILSRVSADSSGLTKSKRKMAVKQWLDEHRENRRNDRRFSGDAWEITFEELKTWAAAP